MIQQRMEKGVVLGTPTERLVWVALWHTTWWTWISYQQVLEHIGGSQRSVDAALMNLLRRGIVRMQVEDDVPLFRLSEAYTQRISMAYRRMYPNAEVHGGHREPTLDADIGAIGYLLGDFPVESVRNYFVNRFLHLCSDEEKKRFGKKLKSESDGKRPVGGEYPLSPDDWMN